MPPPLLIGNSTSVFFKDPSHPTLSLCGSDGNDPSLLPTSVAGFLTHNQVKVIFRNGHMMKLDPGIPATVGQEVLIEGKPGGHLATGKDEPA